MTEPISKDEVIVIFGGVIVPRSDIKKYRKEIGGDFGINVDGNFFICPTSRDELKETGVFNHSCDPNMGASGNQIKLIAIRDIEVGEEIVADYTSLDYDFEPFECNCQSKNCKRFIEPTFKNA